MEEHAEQDMKEKKYAEALEKYNSLLTNPIVDPNNYLQRAKCQYYLRNYLAAQSDIREALVKGLKTTSAYIWAGKIATKHAKYEEALGYYKAGLKLDPGNKDIITDLKHIQKEILDFYENQQTDAKEEEINPIKFCSQEIYPGDDVLLKNEKEILEVNYKIVSEIDENEVDPRLAYLPPQLKNAANLAIQGQKCRLQGKVEEALQHYEMAIALDKKNHNFKLMKARLCFELEKDLDALQQLWLIPKTMRTHEIWKMGGMILQKMDLPVLAEFWLRKATQISKNEDLESAVAFQQIRVRRLYEPLCTGFPVKVVFSQYGKCIIATDDIEENGVIFKDNPLVIGQATDTISAHPTCDNCGYSLMEPRHYFGDELNTMNDSLKDLIDSYWPKRMNISCENCFRENYCSKACKQEAWEGYHRVLCPSNNPAASLLYDVRDGDGMAINPETRMQEEFWGGHFSPMILPRIYASILSHAQKMMEEENLTEPTQLHWAISMAPYRRFVAFGTSKAVQKNPLFYSLIQKVFSNYKIKFEIKQTDFEGRYNQATCNLQAFGPYTTPYHTFLANLQDVEMDIHVMQMIQKLNNKPQHASLASLFPLHACTNHSCNNNADILDGEVLGRPGIWVMANRKIRKGEEVNITYIDTSMQQKLRRAWLYRSFHFWCNCQRCEFEGSDANICTNCKKKAPEGKNFSTCGRCKKAWYCSTQCQRFAWKKGHRNICEKAEKPEGSPKAESK